MIADMSDRCIEVRAVIGKIPQHLWARGRMPLEKISVDVGYTGVSLFRSLFKRRTGLSPGQYWRMFQAIEEPA